MQTRKSLKILSKGDKDYSDRISGPLLERSEQYLNEYEATDRRIAEQQATDELVLPFLDTMRRRVSKLVSGPDQNMPIVARFDLYSGIRKLSERANDQGIKRLATQLEHAWHSDPLGTMTYGQVAGLVKRYRDQFPRSKAADAIEAECARVGLHKLPVAKLARIASTINSQEDYDAAMENHGFASDRPEHIRARAMVRSLVSLRGSDVDPRITQDSVRADMRSADERVSDRIASLSKEADYNAAMRLLDQAGKMAMQLEVLLDKASMEMGEAGLERPAMMVHKLSKQLDAWMAGLTDARDDAQPMSEEQVNKMQPKPAPAKPAPAPKTPEEQDLENAGLGKGKGLSKLNPLNWFKKDKKPALASLLRNVRIASHSVEGDLASKLAEFASFISRVEAQVAPMVQEELPEEPMAPEELMVEPAPMAPGEVEPEQVEEVAPAQDMLQQIEQVTQEIVDEAPEADPAVETFLEHERGEGHHSEPIGGPTWGAEEVLLEGHEAPPPSDEWMMEEEEEMAGGGPEEMGQPPASPGLMGAGPHESGVGVVAKAPPGFSEERMHELKREYGPEDAFAVAWSIYNKGHDEKDAVAPPGHEKQVLELKKQPGVENPWAVAWSQHNKEKPSTKHKGEAEEKHDEKAPEPEVGKGKGKGIPMPKGEIKTQPNQGSPEQSKFSVPSNGGKALKASEIEDRLLGGEIVKIGDFTIQINANDEVELWEKDAGRACSIDHLDSAIADFAAMVNRAAAKVQASKLRASYKIEEIVHVPCEICGEMSIFPKAASLDDSYACYCGHKISAASVDTIFKFAQYGKAYQVEVQYQVGQDPVKNKQNRENVLKLIQRSSPWVQINDEQRGYVLATISNAEDHKVEALSKSLQAAGATPEVKRVAQMAPSSAPAPAAPAPAGPSAPPTTPDMPPHEIMQAALTHYKSMGQVSGPGEALAMMYKDYKEREDLKSPENQFLAMQIAQQLWGGTAPAAAPGAAQPEPSMGGAPGPVASKKADSKMKEPAIRKPKDHVSVPKDVGPDSETKESIPTPSGKPKTQPNKSSPELKHMSDGKLDPDSETKDLLPNPGKPSVEHSPKSQPGIKLPKKKLDPDHEPDDPFPVPAPKSEPSVKK